MYFYRDHNGGCAYFDDLGGDWPIHECYKLYLLAKQESGVGPDVIPFTKIDEMRNLDLGTPISILVDRDGPVFALHTDENTRYLRIKYDRSKKYKGRVWAKDTGDLQKLAVALIDEKYVVTNHVGKFCDEPDKVDLNAKCAAAKHAVAAIKSACSRTNMFRKSAYQTPFGVVAVGYTGRSPIVCLSIPIDQIDDSYFEFDDELNSFIEHNLLGLITYLRNGNVIELSASHKLHVIAVVEDNLRYLERAGIEFDKKIDLSELDWTFARSFRGMPLASMSIVDATSDSKIVLQESLFTIKDALDYEEHYVESQKSIYGASMWKRVNFGTAKLGLSDLWRVVNSELCQLGWNLDQRTGDYYSASRMYVIEYINHKSESDVPALLLLLSYSSPSKGLCFLYNGSDDDLFENNTFFIRNVSELRDAMRPN